MKNLTNDLRDEGQRRISGQIKYLVTTVSQIFLKISKTELLLL